MDETSRLKCYRRACAGRRCLMSMTRFIHDEVAASKFGRVQDAYRLFASLAIPERERSSVCVGVRKVPAREIIFYNGDPANEVFVVRSGKVKVSVPREEDGREIIFDILGPGEVFGEMAALEGTDHQATATALETTELEIMNRQEFVSLLQTCPETATKLLMILCVRLRRANELVQEISFLPLSMRLAKKLWKFAKTYGVQTPRGIRINVHLYQQELASLVGTSRESINKQLSLWQAEGLISMENGLFTINQPSEFAALLAPSHASLPLRALA